MKNKEIYLEFCRLENQLADIFTKPLALENFVYQRHNLGIVDVEATNGRNKGGVFESGIISPSVLMNHFDL